MPEKLTVGLDLGGTKMAFAVVDQSGNICEERVIPTINGNPYAVTLDRIAEQLNQYLQRYTTIEGIGVGVPGPVDNKRGIAVNAVNLLWENRPIKADILKRLSRAVPLYIENDVNVGAISEHLFGVAKDEANYVYLSIGTGLGGAVMLDNKLLRGASSSEMEIGHVSLDPVHGRVCTCGQRGCIEMSISGKGLVANAREHYADYPDTSIPADAISTHEIIHHARQGDALARFVIDEAAVALGISCAWCTTIFNPSRIILGGGLIHASYDLMRATMHDAMKARCLPQLYDVVSVSVSQMTNAALGASALVWYFHEKEAS